MSDETRKPTKQPYVAPKLVTYGDITTLTQAMPSAQKADGGGKLKTDQYATHQGIRLDVVRVP